MNCKQEGFESNPIESYEFVSSNSFYRGFNNIKALSSKSINKMVFKSPLIIYNNIVITFSPEQSCGIQALEQNEMKSNLQVQERCASNEPLESIVYKGQKNFELVQGEIGKIILQKFGDIFPKKFICVFNKFHENIFLKSDLTIVVKNISKSIKLQLLKTIDQHFQHIPQNKEKQLNQPTRSRILRKQKRYQSFSHLKNYEHKIDYKFDKNSSFQFQKALILSSQLKSKKSEIQFISNFESGNLHLAFKDKFDDSLFYIFLTNDINTHGFNQWFYFGIKYLGSQKRTFRFVIMNISKEFKFSEQMKLLTLRNKEWERNTSFQIYKNKYYRYNGGNFLSLDFQLSFQEDKTKTVFVALSHPYTYSRLTKLLKDIKSKDHKNSVVSFQNLGKSEIGNYIPVVRIQNHNEKKAKSEKRKNFIVILARQHAGQANSSFVCEYLIKNLLMETEQSQTLLKMYNFVIIPMANPDGVIHGNSRTNIKGYDINRLWETNKPNRVSMMSAQTRCINDYLCSLQKEGNIEYTIDLHSHSKEYGSFVYSCDQSQTSRLFCYFFANDCEECVYEKCKVNMTHEKRCTFRGQMYYRLGAKNSFTIETSYYGFKKKHKDQTTLLVPFRNENFDNISKAILNALLRIQQVKARNEDKIRIMSVISELQQRIKNYKKALINKNRQEDSSSDSDPQNQYLQIKQRQENGQNINNIPKVPSKLQTESVIQKGKNQESQKKKGRSQSFVYQNRSLQMVHKISAVFEEQDGAKKKRKKIYSLNKHSASNQSLNALATINEGAEAQMIKKYTSKTSKELDFRRTLRRGYRMARSATGFYQSVSSIKYEPESKTQQTNLIVYPTSTDIQISYQSVRLLRQNMFKGKILIKSIKQQDRFTRKRSKGHLVSEEEFSKTKDLFKNKYLKEKSEKEIREILCIEKIQKMDKKI